MNEEEQIILQLAEIHRRSPDRFINILEDSLRASLNEKAHIFLHIGTILYNFSYFKLALAVWNKALKYYIKSKDRLGEAACYGGIGDAYRSLGSFRKAIEFHEKSLEIARVIRNESLEAKCYGGLGITYRHLRNFGKAIEFQKKSLRIAKKIGDKEEESKCYTNLGNVYRDLGEFRKAIGFHEESLEIAKDIGDKLGEAICYTNLGTDHRNLGEFRKAIEYHEKSLEIVKKNGGKDLESKCYTGLGNAYRGLGEFRKAIEYHEKSLEITKDIGNKLEEAGCYINLGIAYDSLGNFEKAIDYYKRSLEVAKDIGDKLGKIKCYGNLAEAYRNLGNFGKAIEFNNKSLEIAKDIGDKAEEARCYGGLGNAYCDLGDFNNAIDFYKKSLNIAKEIGDKFTKVSCYGGLGNAYRSLGDFNNAIDFYKKSLEIAKDINDLDSERIGYRELSMIYGNLNKHELAYTCCRHSIELSEMISGGLITEEYKLGFFSRISNTYQYMVSLCLKLKKGNEAFEYAERSKSRSFLDLLAATEFKPTVDITNETKSLLEDEKIYLSKLHKIQTRHLRETKVSMQPGEVDRMVEKLSFIYDKIEKIDPEYAFMRKGKPLSLNRIQNMLSTQKRDVVLIEYFIIKNKTLIFVVSSKNRRLHIETVPISRGKLNQYFENYWREVMGYSGFKEIGDTWLGLSDYLIKPISEYLTEGDLIYFVPYGLLHYLPMHALELKGEPLIRRHPVAYAPSASLIKFCKNKGSGRLQNCASFGVIFKEEAKDVAELFDTEAYSGHRATKDNTLKNCMDKDVIHFSCHGYFDFINPLSSGVELYDGVLTAREIFDMRLNTELVTLSACQTGLNERSPGDELIGLTRAFLYAGAPSVVVSLWSVDARSTQELMLEFYTLLKNGSDKAIALQKAQNKIMNKKEYSHPYYWAPFVLVGDWE